VAVPPAVPPRRRGSHLIHDSPSLSHREATTLPERALDGSRIAAIRAARAALYHAACRADAVEIEAAVPPFVHVMWEADFSRQTIRSLVAAAIDAGLPTGRGAARRAQRERSIARWVELAEHLADALVVRR